MFGKYIIVLITLLDVSLHSAARAADITDPNVDLKEFDYWRMHSQPELRRCHTPYCRALYNVSYAWDLLAHRDTPNSLARLKPYPDSFFTDSSTHAARLIASLPDPGLTCLVEQKVVRELPLRYNDPGSFFELMELVSELPSGSEQCRQGIIAAMPATPDNAELVKRADEFVEYSVKGYPELRRWVHLPPADPHP